MALSAPISTCPSSPSTRRTRPISIYPEAQLIPANPSILNTSLSFAPSFLAVEDPLPHFYLRPFLCCLVLPLDPSSSRPPPCRHRQFPTQKPRTKTIIFSGYLRLLPRRQYHAPSASAILSPSLCGNNRRPTDHSVVIPLGSGGLLTGGRRPSITIRF